MATKAIGAGIPQDPGVEMQDWFGRSSQLMEQYLGGWAVPLTQQPAMQLALRDAGAHLGVFVKTLIDRYEDGWFFRFAQKKYLDTMHWQYTVFRVNQAIMQPAPEGTAPELVTYEHEKHKGALERYAIGTEDFADILTMDNGREILRQKIFMLFSAQVTRAKILIMNRILDNQLYYLRYYEAAGLPMKFYDRMQRQMLQTFFALADKRGLIKLHKIVGDFEKYSHGRIKTDMIVLPPRGGTYIDLHTDFYHTAYNTGEGAIDRMAQEVAMKGLIPGYEIHEDPVIPPSPQIAPSEREQLRRRVLINDWSMIDATEAGAFIAAKGEPYDAARALSVFISTQSVGEGDWVRYGFNSQYRDYSGVGSTKNGVFWDSNRFDLENDGPIRHMKTFVKLVNEGKRKLKHPLHPDPYLWGAAKNWHLLDYVGDQDVHYRTTHYDSIHGQHVFNRADQLFGRDAMLGLNQLSQLSQKLDDVDDLLNVQMRGWIALLTAANWDAGTPKLLKGNTYGFINLPRFDASGMYIKIGNDKYYALSADDGVRVAVVKINNPAVIGAEGAIIAAGAGGPDGLAADIARQEFVLRFVKSTPDAAVTAALGVAAAMAALPALDGGLSVIPPPQLPYGFGNIAGMKTLAEASKALDFASYPPAWQQVMNDAYNGVNVLTNVADMLGQIYPHCAIISHKMCPYYMRSGIERLDTMYALYHIAAERQVREPLWIRDIFSHGVASGDKTKSALIGNVGGAAGAVAAPVDDYMFGDFAATIGLAAPGLLTRGILSGIQNVVGIAPQVKQIFLSQENFTAFFDRFTADVVTKARALLDAIIVTPSQALWSMFNYYMTTLVEINAGLTVVSVASIISTIDRMLINAALETPDAYKIDAANIPAAFRGIPNPAHGAAAGQYLTPEGPSINTRLTFFPRVWRDIAGRYPSINADDGMKIFLHYIRPTNPLNNAAAYEFPTTGAPAANGVIDKTTWIANAADPAKEYFALAKMQRPNEPLAGATATAKLDSYRMMVDVLPYELSVVSTLNPMMRNGVFHTNLYDRYSDAKKGLYHVPLVQRMAIICFLFTEVKGAAMDALTRAGLPAMSAAFLLVRPKIECHTLSALWLKKGAALFFFKENDLGLQGGFDPVVKKVIYHYSAHHACEIPIPEHAIVFPHVMGDGYRGGMDDTIIRVKNTNVGKNTWLQRSAGSIMVWDCGANFNREQVQDPIPFLGEVKYIANQMEYIDPEDLERYKTPSIPSWDYYNYLYGLEDVLKSNKYNVYRHQDSQPTNYEGLSYRSKHWADYPRTVHMTGTGHFRNHGPQLKGVMDGSVKFNIDDDVSKGYIM